MAIELETIQIEQSKDLTKQDNLIIHQLPISQIKQVFQKALFLWQSDERYLEKEGLKWDTLPEGTVLPSGIKIGRDEKDRPKLIAPFSWPKPHQN